MPSASIEIGVLGPLSVAVAGRHVTVPGRLARGLLAILALEPGRFVSIPGIMERLWDVPPASARNTLQTYVAHVRKALDPGRLSGAPHGAIETRGDSYRLSGEAARIDATRFQELLVAVRAASGPAERLSRTDEALGLWRGEPLVDLGHTHFAEAERSRLRDLQRELERFRVEALLEHGCYGEAIANADAVLRADPYDEATWALAIRARYAAGRPAGAVHTYQRARRLLAELGIEPSAPLRALEGAVLRHDPALLPQPPPVARGSVRSSVTRSQLRVMIAEDDLLVREGIIRLVGRFDDVDLVAVASTYDEVLDAVDRLAPDVVLTDIRMPPHRCDEGIRVAHRLRLTHPDTGVVVLSQHADPHYARVLFTPAARRRGYLLKEHVGRPDQLHTALRTVADGGSFLDPVIVDLLVPEAPPRHHPA